MSNTEAIQKLRELELRCWEGEMGRLGEWVAECLGDYFAHGSEGRTLEQAFGLASKQGESSWRRNEALAKRDAALREFAEMYLAGMSVRRNASPRPRRREGQ